MRSHAADVYRTAAAVEAAVVHYYAALLLLLLCGRRGVANGRKHAERNGRSLQHRRRCIGARNGRQRRLHGAAAHQHRVCGTRMLQAHVAVQRGRSGRGRGLRCRRAGHRSLGCALVWRARRRWQQPSVGQYSRVCKRQWRRDAGEQQHAAWGAVGQVHPLTPDEARGGSGRGRLQKRQRRIQRE